MTFFFNLHLEKDEICISNILREVDKGIRSCECGVDCDETGYEVKTSSYLWPSPKYEVSYFYGKNHLKQNILLLFKILRYTIFTTYNIHSIGKCKRDLSG